MNTIQALKYEPGAYDPKWSTAFQARLDTPEQVEESVRVIGGELPEVFAGKWMLHGGLTEPMFENLRAGDPNLMRRRISTFTTRGSAYLVLTHQLLTRQHRFLLPLWEPLAHKCVKALHEGKLGFLLSRQAQDEAILLSSLFVPSEVEPVLSQCTSPDAKEALELIAEMRLVVETIRQHKAIPCCYGLGFISEVAVSVLMPEEQMDAILNMHR